MDKKSSVENCRRSPYLCCDGVINSTFIKTALLSAVLILLAVFVILVLIGALYANRNSVFFFVSASILLSAAAMLTLFYIWLNRKRTLLRMQYPSKIPGKTEISTLSGLNYCSQVPSGHKSDFPMGPYLVMTLPKTNNFRGRTDTMDTDSSSNPNTPKQAKKNYRVPHAVGLIDGYSAKNSQNVFRAARRAKNLPPLASAETLTPSLLSSCYGSIDSVV